MIPRSIVQLSATALLAAAVGTAGAQVVQPAQATPAPATSATPALPPSPAALPPLQEVPRVLQPFVATYEVFNGGRALGTATMQVVHEGGARWRIDMRLKGSGLMRLTALRAEQSTTFDSPDSLQYVPISQSLVKRVLLSNKKITGSYDWAAGSARWTGDIKKTRTAPVPLQAGAMSGLLINLAVIRDAQPGKTLSYHFVDNGRAREHSYQVAAQSEPVQVGDLSYDAMRVDRVRSAGDKDQTIIWVASGVPTPVRILQRDDGEDSTDLRLVEYQGS